MFEMNLWLYSNDFLFIIETLFLNVLLSVSMIIKYKCYNHNLRHIFVLVILMWR